MPARHMEPAAAIVTLLSSAISFTDVTSAVLLDAVNVSGDAEKRYILSSLGGGAALVDYDGDGDLDLYLVNGAKLSGTTVSSARGNRLFRNDGDLRFTDVSESAGVADTGWGVGCAAADYDNDGLTDLYVTNLGRNVLYRNRGDGTFEDVTDRTGTGDPGFGASAAFFDAEGDGDLDLYVANYVDPDLSKIPLPGSEPTCTWLGLSVMCGPRGLDGGADVVYRNDGGKFTEASEALGLSDEERAFGLGVVAADYDADGDVDLYVANDTQANFLYRNDGGRFRETGLLSGAAYNAQGASEAGMGVDFGDIDGDGDLDLFVTNFSHETNTLYVSSGDGLFFDETEERGLGTPSLGWLGWGTRFADFDHDGDLDLFIANGHVYPEVETVDTTTSYAQRNQVHANRGDGSFEAPLLLEPRASSRGAALGDLDEDGDVDLFVVNIDGPPTLSRNDLPPEAGAFVGFQLVGRNSARGGDGAIVRIEHAGRRQMGHAHASGSILSSSDPRVHFGLGASTVVDEVRVRWPSGAETLVRNVPANAYHVVVEGLDGFRSVPGRD